MLSRLAFSSFHRPVLRTALRSFAASPGQSEVVLVGCGAPNRGMGWYHAVQMLEGRCPSASLDYIIEPYFLGPGATAPGGPEFNEWAESSKSTYGTVFGTSIKDLPAPKQPRCALISGRTADNPRLFGECIEAGCKAIFLEKPGAPTVSVVLIVVLSAVMLLVFELLCNLLSLLST